MSFDEKKVEERLVAATDLQGLQLLQEEAGLLLTTTQNNNEAGEEQRCCCSSWDSERVYFDAQGRVSLLNLGGKRLHRGLANATGIFAQFSALTTLNLGGTDLPAKDMKQILNIVAPSLESLYAGGNGLGDDGATLIGSWLSEKQPPHLLKVDLRYNDISGTGMAALCDGLKDCNSVIYLHMEGNRIGDAGCEALAKLLKTEQCRLEQVCLGANGIEAEGAAALATAVATMACLQKLYLEGNNIGVVGATAFAEALEEKNGEAKLEHLFVDNNNIGKDGSKRLARALNSASAIPDMED